jgi:hypothetical protein
MQVDGRSRLCLHQHMIGARLGEIGRMSNEAPPQTDEACGGGGSGRRLMTSFW